ncbi:MAG: ribbon-helix-helix domain-containing protein [Hyphomicrobiales bacterium]|nr:ribbon-helix-helix domain-containing protein [Hyphomicrobiales bacterium]
MCQLFVGANRELWEPHTHSLRLHGASTSIRLEIFFWDVLDEVARRDGMTLNELIIKLYDEVIEAEHGVDNFASFLRVCCGRYLRLQADRMIPTDPAIPIRALDAENILHKERSLHQKRRSEYTQLTRNPAEREEMTAP